MKDKNSFFIRGFAQSAILTFMSRISGFIRDIFIAAFLGAGIFSDIFLREDCEEDNREKVMEELNISTIQKFSEFHELAEQNGLMYCNSILYSHDLKFHYTNLFTFFSAI